MKNLVRHSLSAVASCMLVAISFVAVLEVPAEPAFAAMTIATPIVA